MSRVLVHAAVFAAGALVGGGFAAVASSRKAGDALPAPTQNHESQQPIVRLDKRTGQAALSDTAGVPSPVLKYGNPGPVSDLLIRKAYVAGYDRRLRHPAWTAEHLTASSLSRGPDGDSGDRSRSTFVEDADVPQVFRATLKDYFRSGYDRGHMVPAADAKSSQDAMDETFLLSNIAPQVGDGFNRHYWAYLEDWCRKLTQQFSDVYVFTVPLYLPRLHPDGKYRITHEVIGSPPNVAVPTHFAKVVLASKPTSRQNDVHEISTGAFVLPNAIIPDDAPLESFITPVEAVERAAGITLFSDGVKAAAKHICKTTKCQVTIRRFDDARKATKSIGPPRS